MTVAERAPMAGDVLECDGDLSVTTWSDDAPVIGFSIAPFNWRLRRAREAKGWSRAELARQAGIAPGTVGDAERLRHVSENARWKMALALGIPEDVLFPGEIDALPKGGPEQIELSMTKAEMRDRSLPDPGEQLALHGEQVARRIALDGALETLSPRMRRVIELRYGLTGDQPMSLDEVAHQFGVTRERVRQIETKALRALRHPSRAKPLRGLLDGYYEDDVRTHGNALYTDWLYGQRGRGDAIGRHARDVFSRECCVGWSANGLRQHMRQAHGAAPDTTIKIAEKERVTGVRVPNDPSAPAARTPAARPKRPTPAPAPPRRPPFPSQPGGDLPMWVAVRPRTETEARATMAPAQLAGWEALNRARRRLGLPEVWG